MAGLPPYSLADIFRGLFGPRPPYLHMWLFPAAMALSAANLLRKKSQLWQCSALIAAGWVVHLVLDGVLLL